MGVKFMKSKKVLFVAIVLMVVSFLLIPCEALFFNIPAWVFILSMCAATAVNIFFLTKFKIKIAGKICLCVFNFLLILFILIYTTCYPYFGGTVFKINPHYYVKNSEQMISSKKAHADLDFVLKKLNKIHVAMKDKKSVESQKVLEAYKKSSDYINSKKELTVIEVAQQIESMLSVLGDAHSTVYINYIESEHYYKMVQNHNDADDEFIGINGKLFDDLLKEKSNLYSYEKESWAIHDMKNHSIKLEGLKYLGIDFSSGVSYMIKKKDGTIFEEKATVDDFLTYDEYMKFNKIEGDNKPFCYYSIDEEKSLALFTLKSCKHNKIYSDTLKQMFTEIKEKGIKNLAIDVRENGGGSSLVINELFRYLNLESYKESGMIVRLGPFMIDFKNPLTENNRIEDLIFDGKVYLLCSNSSFSSAMQFAQYVKDNNVGKLIGEAPGNNPNGYGEVVHFDLPNSHLFVQISRKQFKRVNQNTDEIYVEPDYPCSSNDALKVLENVLQENN